MKTTKRQLKRIISEYGEPYIKGSGQREVPRGDGYRMMIANLAQDVLEYYSDTNIGPGVFDNLEDAMEQVLQDEDLHKDAMVRGHLRAELSKSQQIQEGIKMKLTKNQVKRLIREEHQKLIKEGQGNVGSGSAALEQFGNDAEIAVHQALEDLYWTVVGNAEEAGEHTEDAEDLAGMACLAALRSFYQEVGHLGDAHYRASDKRW